MQWQEAEAARDHAAKKADDEEKARRRAEDERDAKERALRRAEGLRLTALSSASLPTNPGLALLLGIEGRSGRPACWPTTSCSPPWTPAARSAPCPATPATRCQRRVQPRRPPRPDCGRRPDRPRLGHRQRRRPRLQSVSPDGADVRALQPGRPLRRHHLRGHGGFRHLPREDNLPRPRRPHLGLDHRQATPDPARAQKPGRHGGLQPRWEAPGDGELGPHGARLGRGHRQGAVRPARARLLPAHRPVQPRRKAGPHRLLQSPLRSFGRPTPAGQAQCHH